MSGTISATATLDSLHRDGGKIIAIGSSMLSIATASVGFRLIAKHLNKNGFGLDDLLIGFALLFFAATESLVLQAVGVGRRAVDVQDQGYVEFAELTVFYSIIYWSVVAFATLSILFLYRRIFYMHRFFSAASLVLIGLTLMWWISGTICEALAFRPMSAFWDTSLDGHYYIDYDSFWVSNMIAELVLETAILILPLREVARLQLENGKRALVAVMFCMGIFVLITGIIRIHYVWTQSDMTLGVIWISVHSCTAIVSACLPTYGPLLRRIPFLKNSIYRSRRGHTSRSGGNNHTIGSISIRQPIGGTCGPSQASPRQGRNSLDDIFLDEAQLDEKNKGDKYSGKPHVYHDLLVSVRERGASESTKNTSIDCDYREDHDRSQRSEDGKDGKVEEECSIGLSEVALPPPASLADRSRIPAAAFPDREEELQAQTWRWRLEHGPGPGLPSLQGEEEEKIGTG